MVWWSGDDGGGVAIPVQGEGESGGSDPIGASRPHALLLWHLVGVWAVLAGYAGVVSGPAGGGRVGGNTGPGAFCC